MEAYGDYGWSCMEYVVSSSGRVARILTHSDV